MIEVAKELKECRSISQGEGYFKCNNSVYFGHYTGGKYYSYQKIKLAPQFVQVCE
jgi:hypothetical protein